MYNKNTNKWLHAVAGGILLGLSSGMAAAQTEIPVTFQANGCPLSGSVPDISASRGQTLKWQAKNEAGQDTNESFSIFFDPIQGATIRAQNGSATRPINGRAPTVAYKYTIVSDRCESQPEDPMIVVNN